MRLRRMLNLDIEIYLELQVVETKRIDSKSRYLTLRKLFFLFCSFIFLSASGLTNKQITLTDSTQGFFIGKSVYYIKDYNNQWGIEEILDPSNADSFTLSNKEKLGFGNHVVTIWSKFIVKSLSTKNWYLSVFNYNIDTLTLYYKDKSGNLIQVHSGSSWPASQREIKIGAYAFKLPVEYGDSITFYLKGQGYKPEYPIFISQETEFIFDLHVNNLIKGIYFGLALMFIIYNLVLYISIKDKNYLYFTLTILFTALLQSEHAGINAFLWWDKFHFLWDNGSSITALGSIFFMVYSKSFLETKRHAPIADYIISYIFIPPLLIAIILNIISNKYNIYASVINQVDGFANLIFMTFVAVYIYRKGFRPARFYILACSFYFMGAVIFILKTFALIPYNFLSKNSLEMGSAAMMMLFALSMADRMKIFKKEKKEAQKELLRSLKENEKLITDQNKLLETKVEERTKELQETLGELEESKAELLDKNVAITEEKERSDKLLLNILPPEVAKELKEKGTAEAKQYDQVTVMFTDFIGFTKIAETLTPTELVQEIHECFKSFDEIIKKYNIEKIKTIGDSYMCVGGLPVANTSNPIDVVSAAIEIQEFMKAHLAARTLDGRLGFETRIGIHTGPVVAGIVGITKFAYDIWGDTVNTASRLENSGQAGKVNISGATYELIKHKFKCEYRGKIEVKNKDAIDMYFIDKRI
ncbi:MAG: adenylate/guanylate cyclase domain-containing protein [Bacteroidia bacterium]